MRNIETDICIFFTNIRILPFWLSIFFIIDSRFLLLMLLFLSLMPCERVNCAQCLTVMALRKQTRRLKTFLQRFEKSQPFDPYVVVAFTSLPWFIRFSHNEGEDILQVQDYLLLHPNDPQLSFNERSPSLMQPNQPWKYQVRPCYCIIFNCKTVDPDIVTMSITSHCFNPLQIHHEIWRVYEFAGLDGTGMTTSKRSWSRSLSYQHLQRPTLAITWGKSSSKQTLIAHSQQQWSGPITGSRTLAWDLKWVGGSNITRTMRKGICSGRASSFSLHKQTEGLGRGRTLVMIIAIGYWTHSSTWALMSMSMHLIYINGGRAITHHYH